MNTATRASRLSGRLPSVRLEVADPLTRLGLEHVLERSDEVGLVADDVSPDVIVVGLGAGTPADLSGLASLRRRFPDSRLLALGATDDDETLLRAIGIGARAFVARHDLTELPLAIRAVAGGQDLLAPLVTRRPALLRAMLELRRSRRKTSDQGPLTPREREVLSMAAAGMTTSTIADRLGIGPQAVKNHVGRAMRRLGVSTRTAAVALAIAQGWIEPVA